MVIEAKDETFHELIQEGVCIVDFYSTHCGPCRAVTAMLLKLEADFPFISVVKVNTDYCPKLAEEYQISALPTIYFVKDGEMKEYQGVMQIFGLEEKLSKLLYE